MSEPINLDEFEQAAKKRLERPAYDYFAGGADDELSLAGARAAFARLRLRPRVLVDVTRRDLRTTAFGRELPHPIVVAPSAAHGLAHPDAECETFRGSAAAQALFTLSTVSSKPMEEVASVAPDAARWFQLYVPPRRADAERLMGRAVAAGFGAVAVTVDLPELGNRERDTRNAFAVPRGAHLEPDEEPEAAEDLGSLVESGLDWDGLAWLRERCPVPMVLKGVLRADDAARAVEGGIDGIWVSNHGGRQLDTAMAPIDALPEVVAAVGDRALIVLDGGVRRGTDIVKALALGADLVAIGRPPLWGLTVDGASGVQRVIELLRDELSLAMALAGCPTIGDITPDLVAV